MAPDRILRDAILDTISATQDCQSSTDEDRDEVLGYEVRNAWSDVDLTSVRATPHGNDAIAVALPDGARFSVVIT